MAQEGTGIGFYFWTVPAAVLLQRPACQERGCQETRPSLASGGGPGSRTFPRPGPRPTRRHEGRTMGKPLALKIALNWKDASGLLSLCRP